MLPAAALMPSPSTPGALAQRTLLNAPMAQQIPPELQRVAEEFEAMTLGQLLQPMFAALSTDGLGGGGIGEELFRPMLVNEYASGVARQGGIGLAQQLVHELMRLQAAQQTSADAAAASETSTTTSEPPHGADR